MTLISLRKNLFRKVKLEEFLNCSNTDFKLYFSLIKFNEILRDIGLTSKTIGQYKRAVEEFLIFLDLIDIRIEDVIESDLELYREILLKRSNNKRSAKTKITRINVYLYIYSKINEHESMQGDLSTLGILKEVKQIISE